jgi:ankyrin repeat protein
MMWAGGDPRSRGPNLEKDYTEDPECYTSGLEEACYSGHVEVLKKLKPHPAHDNFAELLRCASICRRVEALTYLLELGANPNDKANGGSSALDT